MTIIVNYFFFIISPVKSERFFLSSLSLSIICEDGRTLSVTLSAKINMSKISSSQFVMRVQNSYLFLLKYAE